MNFEKEDSKNAAENPEVEQEKANLESKIEEVAEELNELDPAEVNAAQIQKVDMKLHMLIGTILIAGGLAGEYGLSVSENLGHLRNIMVAFGSAGAISFGLKNLILGYIHFKEAVEKLKGKGAQ